MTCDVSKVLGPDQLTDTHLLARAVRHGGRLLSSDRRIDTTAGLGATAEHLVAL